MFDISSGLDDTQGSAPSRVNFLGPSRPVDSLPRRVNSSCWRFIYKPTNSEPHPQPTPLPLLGPSTPCPDHPGLTLTPQLPLKLFKPANPWPADPKSPFLLGEATVMALVYIFPFLLSPSDWPCCFSIRPIVPWCVPSFQALWVANWLSSGSCLLICWSHHNYE